MFQEHYKTYEEINGYLPKKISDIIEVIKLHKISENFRDIKFLSKLTTASEQLYKSHSYDKLINYSFYSFYVHRKI